MGRKANRPVENRDPDGYILKTVGIAALIALEKRLMLIHGSVLGIPYIAEIARPREGADIV